MFKLERVFNLITHSNIIIKKYEYWSFITTLSFPNLFYSNGLYSVAGGTPGSLFEMVYYFEAEEAKESPTKRLRCKVCNNHCSENIHG